jgi:hypothetical protein
MSSSPVDDDTQTAIKTPTAIKARTTIGQLISALDDRNVLRALRLLEPAAGDQQDGPRCVKCITTGE